MATVEPVREKDLLPIIESHLRADAGDLYGDLWVVGLQCWLRVGDLLKWKYTAIDWDAPRPTISLSEQKTGKHRLLELNDKAARIIRSRQKQYPNDIYVFQSRGVNQTTIKAVSRQTVGKHLAAVGGRASIDVALGTHSMRKTRAFHEYKRTNDLAYVQHMLQHKHSSDTLLYIGINSETTSSGYDIEL